MEAVEDGSFTSLIQSICTITHILLACFCRRRHRAALSSEVPHLDWNTVFAVQTRRMIYRFC